jgi:hypothetical protein
MRGFTLHHPPEIQMLTLEALEYAFAVCMRTRRLCEV